MSDPTTQTPQPSVNLGQAVSQLRILVLGLGVMVLALSVAFNLFVWKQNQVLVSSTDARKAQWNQAVKNVQQLSSVANDLANYSEGRPELVAIFKHFGIDLKNVSPAGKP